MQSPPLLPTSGGSGDGGGAQRPAKNMRSIVLIDERTRLTCGDMYTTAYATATRGVHQTLVPLVLTELRRIYARPHADGGSTLAHFQEALRTLSASFDEDDAAAWRFLEQCAAHATGGDDREWAARIRSLPETAWQAITLLVTLLALSDQVLVESAEQLGERKFVLRWQRRDGASSYRSTSLDLAYTVPPGPLSFVTECVRRMLLFALERPAQFGTVVVDGAAATADGRRRRKNAEEWLEDWGRAGDDFRRLVDEVLAEKSSRFKTSLGQFIQARLSGARLMPPPLVQSAPIAAETHISREGRDALDTGEMRAPSSPDIPDDTRNAPDYGGREGRNDGEVEKSVGSRPPPVTSRNDRSTTETVPPSRGLAELPVQTHDRALKPSVTAAALPTSTAAFLMGSAPQPLDDVSASASERPSASVLPRREEIVPGGGGSPAIATPISAATAAPAEPADGLLSSHHSDTTVDWDDKNTRVHLVLEPAAAATVAVAPAASVASPPNVTHAADSSHRSKTTLKTAVGPAQRPPVVDNDDTSSTMAAAVVRSSHPRAAVPGPVPPALVVGGGQASHPKPNVHHRHVPPATTTLRAHEATTVAAPVSAAPAGHSNQ